MKMVCAFDMDSVIADLMVPWLINYNWDFNDKLTVEKITDWDMHQFVKPECGKRIYSYLHDKHLYDNCPVIDGSQEAIQLLIDHGHEVLIVSAASAIGDHIAAKVRWLQKHFPMINKKNYIFTNAKHHIRAHFLVDDGHHNLVDFRGHRILFDQPWNQHIEDKSMIRMKSWAEFERLYGLLVPAVMATHT